jgi:hypothetical protein
MIHSFARRATRGLAAALVVGSLALLAGADILHMKDGRQVEGVVVEETDTVVRLRTRLGVLDFRRADIERIERKKSAIEEFEERWARAESGDDFHALGLWAEERRMRKEVKKCMRRAVEVDPDHEGAHTWLGHVRHEGEWMTPEERDRRLRDAERARRGAEGLVEYRGRWVTPEEKANLEAGLVLHEGEWMSFEEAQRARGLEDFEGRWVPRPEALALRSCAAAAALAAAPFERVTNEQALVAGTVPLPVLEQVAAGLLEGRAWFDEELGVEPGLALLAGRPAEFYAFAPAGTAYEDTVAHFAGLTPTLPEGWAPVARKAYGFFWTDPYTMSSARQAHRGEVDVVGHCYHHWGHMLLGRLDYDGRLLPPWYEEAFASLLEFRVHSQNRVFCRARTQAPRGGTVSTGARRHVDPAVVRRGDWRAALRTALEERQVLPFDRLQQQDFSDLEVIDIATGMALLEWIDSRGEESLRRFHRVLRSGAPKAPARIVEDGNERTALAERAFQEATGMGWREADRAWRAWFLER